MIFVNVKPVLSVTSTRMEIVCPRSPLKLCDEMSWLPTSVKKPLCVSPAPATNESVNVLPGFGSTGLSVAMKLPFTAVVRMLVSFGTMSVGGVGGGCTVMFTVAMTEFEIPSFARKVKESGPL